MSYDDWQEHGTGVDLLAKVLLYQVGSTRVSTRFSTVQSKSSALIPRTSRSQAIGLAICNCASISIFLSAAPPVLRLGHPAFRLTSLGCVWFAFLSEPDPRGAGERRLIACTAPRVRLSGCIFLPLACIPRNARNDRFCKARLGSCSCFSR
jgi:hypothetical protein